MNILQAPATEKVINLARLMLKDQENAPSLYQPTKFWIPPSQKIMSDLEACGIENFKSMPSAEIYFVGAYRPASINEQIEDAVTRLREINIKIIDPVIKNFLNGNSDFMSDYRVLASCSLQENPLVHIDQINENEYGNPRERHYLNGNLYTHTNLKYAMGLQALANVSRNKGENIKPIKTFLEIGGGYGSLGEILLNSDQEFHYFNVDIPPLAAISTAYLQEILGKEAVLTYEQSRKMKKINLNDIKKKYKAAIFCPWQLPSIVGNIDVFVNFISFQEMEPDVVNNYIQHISDLTPHYVLLRNSRDGKRATQARVTNDFTVEEFQNFNYQLQYRGAIHFGLQNDQFASEVLVLTHTPQLTSSEQINKQSTANRRFQLCSLLSGMKRLFRYN